MLYLFLIAIKVPVSHNKESKINTSSLCVD